MIYALIDGDWILYAAGFAGQRPELVAPEFFGTQTFKNITEMRELDDSITQANVYKRDVLDPEAHFYHSAKSMIERNVKGIAEKFNTDVVPRVFLDGDGNFRSRIATIRPYKGTRSAHAKPLMYNNIRQYLLDAWDAYVVYDQETDDELAIRQTLATEAGGDTIIVGVDKDMLQVPGWHLNPNKGFKRISVMESWYRLYAQCITGDSVDNIAGAYKYGPKAAKAALKGIKGPDDMWDATVACYQASIDKHGNKYNGLSARAAAIENMRLVYLRRQADELWEPPKGG